MPGNKEMLSLVVRPFIALASVLPMDVNSHIHPFGSIISCWNDPIFDLNYALNSLWLEGQIIAAYLCSLGK